MWLLLPTRLSRSGSGRSRRLEKLHDVPAPVLDQDLFPARARDDLVSKRNAVPLHDPDPRLEVRDLHHEAIPSPGDGLPSIRHRPRGGALRSAQPERGVAETDHRERLPPPLDQAEAELLRIELHGAIDIVDQIADDGHVRTPCSL